MSILHRNEYRPEESGVDMSTPVHPVVLPLVRYLNPFRADGTSKSHRESFEPECSCYMKYMAMSSAFLHRVVSVISF